MVAKTVSWVRCSLNSLCVYEGLDTERAENLGGGGSIKGQISCFQAKILQKLLTSEPGLIKSSTPGQY